MFDDGQLDRRLSSRAVESGREACRVRKSPAYRDLTASVWSVPVTIVDTQMGDAVASGRL